MQTFKSKQDLRAFIHENKSQRSPNQTSVALVPTMGNLHQGHLSLTNIAKEKADLVVASIFVNPSQFGPNEDFDTYPRSLEKDKEQLENQGVDALFVPSIEDIYPLGMPLKAKVQVPALTNILCGASRPGHFDGVATIVSILFNIVQPDIAVFGRKDFQQLKVIETLCTALGFNIQIIGAPIVREPSQLAMSSRNQYLTSEEHQQASQLFKTLEDAKEDICRPEFEFSEKRIQSLCDHATLYLADQGFLPEYFTLRRSKDLSPALPEDKSQQLVLLAAAKIGNTRLIDNIEFLPAD